MASAADDLPDPDSPTRPTNSRSPIESAKSLTATRSSAPVE